MKVVIAGPREISQDQTKKVKRPYTEAEVLWMIECLDQYHKHYPITEVVSGNAVGADKIGEFWAKRNNIPTKIFIPEWDKYSPPKGSKNPAGIIRNREMAVYADRVICFWDGYSNGTKNMIETATKLKKTPTVWNLDYHDTKEDAVTEG